MKLCIFCSANNGIDPDFFESAENLGVWAAKNGHSIVFGGHDAGLMHAVSKAAKEAGGQVIGVVPRKTVVLLLVQRGICHLLWQQIYSIL